MFPTYSKVHWLAKYLIMEIQWQLSNISKNHQEEFQVPKMPALPQLTIFLNCKPYEIGIYSFLFFENISRKQFKSPDQIYQ